MTFERIPRILQMLTRGMGILITRSLGSVHTIPYSALTLVLGECIERMQRGEEKKRGVELQSLHLVCQTQELSGAIYL